MKPVDCQDLYNNAEFYEYQCRSFTDDLNLYLKLARALDGDILELACGTGRLTLPLAQAGHRVTGIDINKSMLSLAKKKSSDLDVDVTWVEDDIRTFKLDKIFKLIFIPVNSICHIHDRASLEALFTSVKAHLHPQGRFVISVFIPDPAMLIRDSSGRYPVSTFEHPKFGPVEITENNKYEWNSQINRIKWYYKVAGKPEFVIENNMRMFFPQELQTLLAYNGFHIEKIWGDYQMTEFDNRSTFQIYSVSKS